MSTLVQEVSAAYKRRLVEQCGEHFVEMRIFGSRARSDAREDSDLDIFVMIDTDDRDIRALVSHAAWDIAYELELPFAINPLTMTREHFQELSRRERLIAREIESEGVPV